MNNLNNNNLKDLVISTFQEILTEDPNFFFTDRLSILTWKSKKITGALITKVGNIRYLGLLRKDSTGQEYWKYKPLNKPSESASLEASTPDLSAVEKFQQRQAKAQAKQNMVEDQANNYGKTNSTEQSVNHSATS